MILSNVVARLPQQDGARESTRNATAGRATHNAMRTRLLAVALSPIVLASSAPSIIIVHLKSKEAHIFLLRSSRMKHQTQAMKPYVLSQAAGVARQLRLVAPPAWVRAEQHWRSIGKTHPFCAGSGSGPQGSVVLRSEIERAAGRWETRIGRYKSETVMSLIPASRARSIIGDRCMLAARSSAVRSGHTNHKSADRPHDPTDRPLRCWRLGDKYPQSPAGRDHCVLESGHEVMYV